MGHCGSCGSDVADGATFCSECGAPVAVADREQRKSVTVVFCDLAGSTALGESTDPEALRRLLARYFARMRAVVERHGGTVEKFIGDAVMAVFGIPVVHEDDALRACRAALEMHAALPELGLRGRIGVCSGEVVTGTAERLATGDAVNVAARLEQAAGVGEVLLGAATHRLVRAAVEVGEERLLELKGKSAPVAALPLLSVVGDEQASRRRDGQIVGRARELRALEDAWQRASEEGSCHLFTLLGAAGVGKSRLAAEFATIAGAPVVSGRCLPYGDGITYAPAVEIASRLGRRPSDPRAATAIASLLGETGEVVAADETAWAFRKLLEEAAPVVCVFDDLHWAEPTLLDLVEHVADWSREAPILLLCLARPELLERRSGWGGGKLHANTLLLDSLDARETEELLGRLLGDAPLAPELSARILAAADGNPLFVEEMLAMVAEAPDSAVVVPPTIQALLAARLDQLAGPERSVLERASIEGQVFHVGGVEALAPGEAGVGAQLLALVRKELLRPGRAELPGEEAFRFRHLLIRDAAYESLAKATRAELHERFADWLEVRGAGLVELDELCGYHLERAAAYRRELGLDDERTSAVARRASRRLGAAGERAFLRRDMSAAVGLLTRALAAADELDVRRELTLAHALQESGDVPAALARVDELIARTAHDERLRLHARMARIFVGLQGGSAFDPPAVRAECAQAVELLERLGDDAGLALAWRTLGLVEIFALQALRARDALQRAAEHALRAGDPTIAQVGELWQGSAYAHGPFPVDESLAWFADRLDAGAREPLLYSFVGDLEAMRGRFAEARRASDRAREEALERGQRLVAAGSAMHRARIELAAGEPEAAADVALQACVELEAYGEHGWLSTIAGLAAEALYRLGRDDEAYAQTELAERVGSPDDVLTQMLILQVRAKLAARRGDLGEAVSLGERAVELAEPIDALDAKGDALLDLASVLLAAGLPALAALDDAERTYAAKGHSVGLARVAALRASTTAGAASSAGADPRAAGGADGGGGTGSQ
jgi:class 3 adenylate cyclase/tetratricopeptide (TPR) repeat protein